ncbi:S-acyl fatty acid synthase thioesterase [Striga asiatica]|uniref:S-acyl fatty acid synthase thioesterase n=1 Tax=Striga asiatica TaxID=4170 RepID=A0A5A7R2Q3_STRAF|nr:S-acyl fatty acid synthase thioesterase [Striga asiatica]
MAHNCGLALFLIALVFAASNPLAHGQQLNVTGLTVSGRLCCTPTGNCPGQGVPGALVSLNCTNFLGGGTITVGQTRTSINGTFNITVPRLTGLDLRGFPNISCVASVNLPLNSAICPVLSTVNGTLVATLSLVEILLSETLVVARLLPGVFTFLFL